MRGIGACHLMAADETLHFGLVLGTWHCSHRVRELEGCFVRVLANGYIIVCNSLSTPIFGSWERMGGDRVCCSEVEGFIMWR